MPPSSNSPSQRPATAASCWSPHNFVIGWFVRHVLDAPEWRWMGLNQFNAALTILQIQSSLLPQGADRGVGGDDGLGRARAMRWPKLGLRARQTYDMMREYTEARGVARAHDAYARLSPGDRI
jgi:hypothetical protein